MSEDHTRIEAHKVILAASSNFFRDLLKQSHHPHPLLYLRGVRGVHLSAVVDFMYLGEVNVVQEELNDFLKAAEELQLKGLTGTGEVIDDSMDEIKDNTNKMQKSVFDNKIIIPKTEDPDQEHINFKDEENQFGVIQTRELVQFNAAEMKTTTYYEELDDTIDSMMIKSDGVWKCTQCEKIFKVKTRLRDHIEVHIDGVTHPCNQCGKQFRSRNSLKNHNSVFHKQC